MVGRLLDALGLRSANAAELRAFAERADVRLEILKTYVAHETLPPSPNLEKLCRAAGVTPAYVRLALGKIDRAMAEMLARNHSAVWRALSDAETIPDVATSKGNLPPPDFKTRYGKLYRGDCIDVMAALPAESIDVVFADPPFNLRKLYPSRIDDDLKESKYLDWSERWVEESVRLLKPGGSLFVWNLPRWNTYIASHLNRSMTFRHWIAVDIKYSLPISGRLYPSHYSLLYYTKGSSPNKFHPDRLPMEICPHCLGDLRDYGGYKDKMNPGGVNLSDVWFDIPPVRHAKYKRRKDANELSLRLMDRIVELSSDPDDLVLDPFGGAGTTYVACELKRRRWLGIEIGPIHDIERRFANIEDEKQYLERLRDEYNALFTPETTRERTRRGLWTCESVRKGATEESAQASLHLEP